jgi:chaperonin cofactor prefoldin
MDQLHAEIEQLKLRIKFLEKEKKEMESRFQTQTVELKYALFDAEAANRESETLRKVLKDKFGK